MMGECFKVGKFSCKRLSNSLWQFFESKRIFIIALFSFVGVVSPGAPNELKVFRKISVPQLAGELSVFILFRWETFKYF